MEGKLEPRSPCEVTEEPLEDNLPGLRVTSGGPPSRTAPVRPQQAKAPHLGGVRRPWGYPPKEDTSGDDEHTFRIWHWHFI